MISFVFWEDNSESVVRIEWREENHLQNYWEKMISVWIETETAWMVQLKEDRENYKMIFECSYSYVFL